MSAVVGRLCAALWSRPALRRLAELWVLCGFAVAQPLYDVFGKGADVFVFRQIPRAGIIEFTVGLLIGPPLVLWLLTAIVAAFGERRLAVAHATVVALLVAALAIETVKLATKWRGWLVLLIAATLTGGLVVAYLRTRSVRLWLTYATPFPLVFALLFLFGTPVHGLLAGDVVVTRGPVVRATAPVVFLLLDEFPLGSVDDGGRIDETLYPNLDGLARTSTWYRNATTSAWFTPFAVPSLLTGRYPHGEVLPTTASYPDNLFTWLGASYRMRVDELLRLCPTRLCLPTSYGGGRSALARDAVRAFRSIVSPSRGRGDVTQSLAEPTVQLDPDAEAAATTFFNTNLLGRDYPVRFAQFLDRLDGASSRTLSFLHVLLPHAPWHYLPGGHRYPIPDTDPGLVDGRWQGGGGPGGAWPVTLARQRHLLQVQYVDALVGALRAKLERSGAWDKSLVVVTADHGVGFTPGEPRRDVSAANAHQIAFVPTFVKSPGQHAARVVDTVFQGVDLLPTIARELGETLPFRVDGVAGGQPPGAARVFYKSATARQPIDEADAHRKLAAEGLSRFLPARADPLRLYRVGPQPRLVGTAAPAIGAAPTVGTLSVADLDQWAHVSAASGEVPVLVTARVSGMHAGVIELDVNGRVAAVVPTYGSGGRDVAALLPESMLHDGSNTLRAYVVDGGARKPLDVRAA